MLKRRQIPLWCKLVWFVRWIHSKTQLTAFVFSLMESWIAGSSAFSYTTYFSSCIGLHTANCRHLFSSPRACIYKMKKKNILLRFGVVMTFFYFNTTREKENKTKTFRHWKHFPWTCYIFLRLKMTAIIIVPDISSINILSATSSTAFQQHVVFWGIFINVQKIVVC